MATKKKLLEAAAGSAGDAALNVEDVFSTYVYTGTSVSPNTITNGIDLAGDGGLVWFKIRSSAFSHTWIDTERGGNKQLYSDTTGAEGTGTAITSFNSDGFTLGTTNILYNNSSYNYASWTFRKAPKFFDVVTYTGDGTAGRTVSHNLGSVPGFIVVKRTNNTGSWAGYHRSIGNTAAIQLNYANAIDTYVGYWNNTSPTSTEFTLGSFAEVNGNGDTFVAYLFAHNDGDGEFGPTGDQDIIKCGSYAGGTANTFISLGFEPQLVLIKDITANSDWFIIDNMRGFAGDIDYLNPNQNYYESNDTNIMTPRGDGFEIISTNNNYNGTGRNYIYIAIRRGQMAMPTDATEVFAIDTQASGTPNSTSGFVTDAALRLYKLGANAYPMISSRLTPKKYLTTSSTSSETALSSWQWDMMDGYGDGIGGTSTDIVSYMWKRAPGFFDVVTYTGTGSQTDRFHNLTVKPEMIWIKSRSLIYNWHVFYNFTSTTLDRLFLNTASTGAVNLSYSSGYGIQEEPTDTKFVSSPYSNGNWNQTGEKYIAYLFASLPGISKVGSYAGSSLDKTIDCGFSSGARFVLIKNVSGSTAESWYVFDTERGIVAGNDPALFLDTADAEFTGADYIVPHSSGFTLVGGVNATNNITYNYIYYAIA